MNYILVFVGGGIGSLLRYTISSWVKVGEGKFPFATFISNVISCFLFGVLISYLSRYSDQERLKLLFLTGFCGGFSTFSAYSFETLQMIKNGDVALSICYTLSSILICMVALWVGSKLF